MPASKITPIRATTQEFLDIEDITDDLALHIDGSVSLVVETSAVNFGLLSEEEQDAIIYSYAAFLNSLSFPIQISIISRHMDVSSYLDLIIKEEERQTSAKMRAQIRKYYQFILSIVKDNKVLEKKFYIIIPFYPLELGIKAAPSLFGKKATRLPFPKEYILNRAKTSLFPKRDHILRQLSRMGLRGQQLSTQQLIELFYSLYNPIQSENQKVVEGQGFTTPIVTSLRETPAVQAQA